MAAACISNHCLFFCRELVTFAVACVRSAFKAVAARLCKNEDKKIFKWPKCKESRCLMTMQQDKRIHKSEEAGYECV